MSFLGNVLWFIFGGLFSGLSWRGTEISLSDLDIGDNISITFSGETLDTYPVQINDVVRIILLDDEK